MSDALELRPIHRLEPVKLESMGDIKKGNLFTISPATNSDPYEDGKDIYLAEADAHPEEPEGNHGVPAVAVGRVERGDGLPPGIKSVKMILRIQMEEGEDQERVYEIVPSTLNLSEARNAPLEDGRFVGGPKRVMVIGDVFDLGETP